MSGDSARWPLGPAPGYTRSRRATAAPRGPVRLEKELRPRHERPAPRSAQHLRVRRQRRHHPDLRHRGDRQLQARALDARAQRAPGRRATSTSSACRGSSRDGVPIGAGKGRIRVLVAERKLPPTVAVDGHSVDDNASSPSRSRCATRDRGMPTVFVTKDTNLRIRADALGLHAEDYDVERVELDELCERRRRAGGRARGGERLLRRRRARPGSPRAIRRRRTSSCCCATARTRQHTALGRYSAPRQAFVPLIKTPKEGVWGIRPRNKEQSFALDLLLNDDIKLVTSSARRAPARRCSRSPPGCRRRSRRASTRSCSSRGPSSRSGATSATCRATSRRS